MSTFNFFLFDATFPWNTSEYPHIHFQKLESLTYILLLRVCVSIFIQIFLLGSVKRFFPQKCVSEVQGLPRSLILVPIESAYATSYLSVTVTLVLSCTVSEILQVFVLMTPTLFHPNFGGVSVGPDRPCWGQPEHKPYANQP